MKRFITLSVLLLFFTFVKAQTFTVTDLQWGPDLSEHTIERETLKILGATVTLSFYDNDVRIKISENEDAKYPEQKTYIFKKVTDNIYQIEQSYNNGYALIVEVGAKLELEKTLGFIKSAKLYFYNKNVAQCIWTLKRNIF